MSNHEDRTLLGCVPDVLKPVREYRALTLGEQPEIYSVFDEIQGILNNLFLETATEYGIERWEAMLNIIPNPAAETLPFRRDAPVPPRENSNPPPDVPALHGTVAGTKNRRDVPRRRRGGIRGPRRLYGQRDRQTIRQKLVGRVESYAPQRRPGEHAVRVQR